MPSKSVGTVSIIDYGIGNLFSVKRACEHNGLDAGITSDAQDILKSDAVILPGVGAFGDAMDSLRRLDLVGVIKDCIDSGRPFMAICLGMQLLMGESEELGVHEGLKIFKGNVIRLSDAHESAKSVKVPQIGWNRICRRSDGQNRWEGSLLKGIEDGEFMYFIHSYYVKPTNPELAASFTEYEGVRYCSSISHKNVFACQFHPERSAAEGIRIYGNLRALIEERGRKSMNG